MVNTSDVLLPVGVNQPDSPVAVPYEVRPLPQFRPTPTSTPVNVDIDDIITVLWEKQGQRPRRQPLPELAIAALIFAAQREFMSQPMLLRLDAPVKICGDIHGQYHDLLGAFEMGGYPPEANYLFLGDYVDRGAQSLETMCLLLAFKVKYPANFFLLRGNHEVAAISRTYGFFDELKRRYSVRLWKLFCSMFDCLPVAAVVAERLFCCHGGLSPYLRRLNDVAALPRPCDVPETGLLCDLLWSDPAEPGCSGFAPNRERGVSHVFGEDAVIAFCEAFDLDLLVRAHQVVDDGYHFFAGRRCVTVFTAPNYCGEFSNQAAILQVSADLTCSFQLLKRMPLDAAAPSPPPPPPSVVAAAELSTPPTSPADAPPKSKFGISGDAFKRFSETLASRGLGGVPEKSAVWP